jgi:hypothetical protein
MVIRRWKGSSEIDFHFMELKGFARKTTSNRTERITVTEWYA